MNERKQKKCTLRPEWIQWWREVIRVLEDQGHAITENGRVIYRVNKTHKTVTLVFGTPKKPILDQRCIEACGYKHGVFMDSTAKTLVEVEARDMRNQIAMEVAPGVILTRKVPEP